MAEHIEREAVLHLFGEVPAYTGYETYPVGVHTLICEIAPLIKDAIRKIPAADVATVRHGRWEEADDGDGVVCSLCGTDFCTLIHDTDNFLYCPNCGAIMDGGNDD